MIVNMRIAVFYQYLYPDDVASARHFSDLCFGLAKKNATVVGISGNRGCRDEAIIYPKEEREGNVKFRRMWRPSFRQSSILGRIINAVWLILAWSRFGIRHNDGFDVIITGTDPIFSSCIAPFIKPFNKHLKFIHWCFDLYPEAIIAGGLANRNSMVVKVARQVMRKTYRSYEAIVDIGSCMRKRLKEYQHDKREETIVPWALNEPERPQEQREDLRHRLFGHAELGLMYSGNLGMAHAYKPIIKLGHLLRDAGIAINFSVRGNRVAELKRFINGGQSNIKVEGFASDDRLGEHLAAADILLVSLEKDWDGIVVPSKFYGALAAGRPVLFCGPPTSSIAAKIQEHEVGWILNEDNADSIAQELRRLAKDKQRMPELRARCHRVYQNNFSKKKSIDRFADLIQEL